MLAYKERERNAQQNDKGTTTVMQTLSKRRWRDGEASWKIGVQMTPTTKITEHTQKKYLDRFKFHCQNTAFSFLILASAKRDTVCC